MRSCFFGRGTVRNRGYTIHGRDAALFKSSLTGAQGGATSRLMAADTKPKRNALLGLAGVCMVVCRRHLASYSCPKSKHTFTQPQLMTCLILKAHLKQTYRGVVDLLAASDGLRAALGLDDGRVPGHTTLKEFEKRAVTPELLDALVGRVLALCQEHGGAGVAAEVAVDSTGVECSPASRHYELRIGRRRGRYVKLMLVVTCGSILAVAAGATMGPTNDCADCWGPLWAAAGRCAPARAYLDSGFDSERVHRFFRDGMGTASFIPPVPKTADGSVRTEHRAKCVRLPPGYGRRWHVETFISGLKRVCGSAVRARTIPSMLKEALLKVLAYTAFR